MNEDMFNSILEQFGIAPDESGNCLNCRKNPKLTGSTICKVCQDAADDTNKLLEMGIEIEYTDGTKQILRK